MVRGNRLTDVEQVVEELVWVWCYNPAIADQAGLCE